MINIPLLIWVNSPPYVETGAFKFLEDHWVGGVTYAVLGELREERAKMGWGAEVGSQKFLIKGSRSVEEFCHGISVDYPNALHLVAGLSGATGRALSCIVETSPRERIAVYSERPGVHGPFFRRTLRRAIQPIKYRWLVRRFRDRVGLLLPLGMSGVRRFVKYGWPQKSVAPFMYCPPTRRKSISEECHDEPVRFLYVGRLSRYAKGTDILLKATERLQGNWRLTIVGGHGDMVSKVDKWAAGRPNVHVVGGVSPDEVARLMAVHDVCVVPSRVDGWNVVVNEAISAGRGVLVTDSVGSDELVEESGAGMLLRSRSVNGLAIAMQLVVDDPARVGVWNERANDYSPLISPDSVGGYLQELLQAVAKGSPIPRDRVPWLRDVASLGSTGSKG